MSSAVYSFKGGEPQEVMALTSGWKTVRFIKTADGTQVWVLNSRSGPQKTVIAFRGTDEGKDWYTNGDISLEKTLFHGAGKIHRGYQQSVMKPQKGRTIQRSGNGNDVPLGKKVTVAHMLELAVVPEIKDTKHLYITGHSLG
jgi:hypothetical protein